MRDDRDRTIDPERGIYHARRAAALPGVPVRTLHHWALNQAIELEQALGAAV